jgi:hypothetical protein
MAEAMSHVQHRSAFQAVEGQNEKRPVPGARPELVQLSQRLKTAEPEQAPLERLHEPDHPAHLPRRRCRRSRAFTP